MSPDLSRRWGLGTRLVTVLMLVKQWARPGGVAPRAESSNQIAERVIICDDVAIEHENKPKTNFSRSSFVMFSAVAR